LHGSSMDYSDWSFCKAAGVNGPLSHMSNILKLLHIANFLHLLAKNDIV